MRDSGFVCQAGGQLDICRYSVRPPRMASVLATKSEAGTSSTSATLNKTTTFGLRILRSNRLTKEHLVPPPPQGSPSCSRSLYR